MPELRVNSYGMTSPEDQIIVQVSQGSIAISRVEGTIFNIRAKDWSTIKAFVDQQLSDQPQDKEEATS